MPVQSVAVSAPVFLALPHAITQLCPPGFRDVTGNPAFRQEIKYRMNLVISSYFRMKAEREGKAAVVLSGSRTEPRGFLEDLGKLEDSNRGVESYSILTTAAKRLGAAHVRLSKTVW
jgi:hypothetical protein